MPALTPACVKLDTCPKLLLFTTLVAVATLLCGLYPQESVAQDGDSDLQNSMLYQGVQSPTAASLGRFGDIPVGLYTGTPNVEIPLLELDELDLSISLKYHSSGTKVNDIGGWVGMGWALQSGGVITRTVRGLPDDQSNGYYNTGNATRNAWEGIRSGEYFEDEDYAYSLIREEVDGEPDTFFFNIGGKSGQFVLGPDGESDIRTTPAQNIRFEITEGIPEQCELIAAGGGFTEWKITTEDGTTYVFADTEITRELNEIDRMGQQQYVSSWYLSRIEPPTGDDIIHFEYENHSLVQHDHPAYERATYITGGPLGCETGHDRTNKIQETCTPVLKRITTRRQEVIFETSARQDIDGAQKLDKIIVNERQSNKNIHVFNFDYQYNSNRLYLHEVQKENTDPYVFSYDSPNSLPSDRTSLARDHWGYYNGALVNNSRNTLIPTQSVNLITGPYRHLGADRSPNADYASSGVLNRIDYPTGGSTLFEYESHDYGQVGLPPKSDLFESVTKSKSISHSDGERQENITEFEIAPGPEDYVMVDFVAEINRDESVSCLYVACPRVSFQNPSDESDNFEIVHEGYGDKTWERSLLLESGQSYVIKSQTYSPGEVASIEAKWKEKEEVSAKIAGGARIKKIIDYDGVSEENNVVRRYNYTTVGSEDTSSGVLVRKPQYRTYSPDHTYVCDQVELSSASYRGLGSTQGSIVGYEAVEVVHSENGISRHSYRGPADAPDYGVDIIGFAFAPVSSRDWQRGLETSHEIFNENLALERRQMRSHELAFTQTQRQYPAIAYKLFPGTSDAPFEALAYPHRYEVISRWVYPTSETVTHVGENGEEATTTTSYTYEEDPSALAFMQRRSEEVTTSESGERTTTYEYAHEDHAPAMGRSGTHQLSEIYRTTVTNAAEEVLRRSWTTWREHPDAPGWVPDEEWVWTGTD